jgi:23S rRNA (adenine2503-C2)-methyltransferase
VTAGTGCRRTRYRAALADLEALVEAAGEPRYRARQAWEGLWRQRRPLEALTALPAVLRARLADALPLALAPASEQHDHADGTTKWLWRTAGDGAQVETVLMTYPHRATVCVSSQAGCAMGCTFCATGQVGFERHLDAGEIVEQVMRAQHATAVRVSNVVFMGMGEPLANVEAVVEALDRLHRDLGVSARRLTISTVGVVPGMRALAAQPLPVTLAVSVHAADDALRTELVPLNRRYPLAQVLDAARDYAALTGRRVTFEYACIDRVNDHEHQADHLADRLTGFRGGAHVNLIPLNPTVGFTGSAPDPARIAAFARRLRDRGVNATVRRNRGVGIDAACGQLRARARRAVPSARMAP